MILQRQVTLQKAARFYHTVVVIERRPGVMTAQPGGWKREESLSFGLLQGQRTMTQNAPRKKKEESRNIPPLSSFSCLYNHVFLLFSVTVNFTLKTRGSYKSAWLSLQALVIRRGRQNCDVVLNVVTRLTERTQDFPRASVIIGSDRELQLIFLKFRSEISLVLLEKLQSEGFPVGLSNRRPISILSALTKAAIDLLRSAL